MADKPTIHQRVHLHIWHWKTGPGWVTDASEMLKLYRDGARVIKIQLQDERDENGNWLPVPRALCDEYRACGFKVWGMVRPSNNPLGEGTWGARETAEWIRGERVRLALAGVDCNFEDEVRAEDNRTSGEWSGNFVKRFRELCPTLPAHLDTYHGSAGGGINLGAYRTYGFRFSIQTFWGKDGIWDDPTTRIVAWCAGAQPVIPKSVVKPIFRVAPNNYGELPNWEEVFANTKMAGTIGCAFYYVDGAPDLEFVRDLVRKAITRGIAK